MTEVFLISKNPEYQEILATSNFNVKSADVFYENIFDEIVDFKSKIIVVDSDVENSKINLVSLIAKNMNKEFTIFYLINENEIEDFSENGAKIFVKPLNKKVLINEINLALEVQNSINNLHKENMELKKNLYQIDTFYNASSKFAGTLDKEKLYEVMFETFDRILSFDVASVLFKDNFEEDKLKFYIHSLKKTTDETNSNLIKRLSLTAKEEGLANLKTNNSEVEIIQKTKPSYKNEFYDDTLSNFDTLYAPIVIKDKFEGIVEVFRKNSFSKEDVTCFQSIVHQLLAPLRSAVLYEDMIKTNIKLKNLERMKSEFVSIVSHELRTPLTPINNALSIILSGQGGEISKVNKNFANIAKRNVSRLSGIIEDLLDLSRMQTGKFDFKFKKTNIYSSLELAYNTFKNQTSTKNIDFKLEADENLEDIYMDSHRVEQILSNLITNAIKFTDNDGKITVSAKIIDSVDKNILINPVDKDFSSKFVQISIQDTGIGIEEEDIPKIFDKFSQIENTLSRNTGGIGLGLTITKHFIDAHLGGIWVESKKNEGSIFNVIFPLYSEEMAFQIELNLRRKNGIETGFIQLEEKNGTDFYSNLKEDNIIKLTKNSKELTYNFEDKCVSKVFISGIDRSAYDFMISKIENEITEKGKTCDIVLTRAFYKKDTN